MKSHAGLDVAQSYNIVMVVSISMDTDLCSNSSPDARNLNPKMQVQSAMTQAVNDTVVQDPDLMQLQVKPSSG